MLSLILNKYFTIAIISMRRLISLTKIKLWTRQNRAILDILERDGVYYAKKEVIQQKFGGCTDVVLKAYNWYVQKAKTLVPMPEGAQYPIWLSTSEEFGMRLTDDNVILEIEVDSEKALIFDMEKWGYIVNFWYLPRDGRDKDNHESELKRYGISNEASIFLNNYHPFLKSKVEKSWDRLFDESFKLSDLTVATLWEIKREWITNIIKSEGDMDGNSK